MKIIVFIINLVVQLAAGALGLFMLLLGLNGFSERQATPGLLFYVVSAVVSAIGLGVASALTAGWLVRSKSFGGFGASAAAVAVFSFAGWVILVVGFFAAVLIASAMRGMR